MTFILGRKPRPHPELQAAEFRLLVAATAWPANPKQLGTVRTLVEQCRDWEKIVTLTERHRVAGLMVEIISRAGVLPPAPIWAKLSRKARVDAADELLMLSTTIILTGQFKRAGVEVAVLKGVTTALSAFGRLGVRYSSDIDLLVEKKDVERAAAVIGGAGYVRTEPAIDASAAILKERMARHKDLVFVHPKSGAVIELHWRLFQNPYIMAGAERGPFEPMTLLGGAAVPTLQPDLALLYLCVHGGEHGWERLKWLADLVPILNRGEGVGDRLYRDARKRGLRRMVGPGIALCHEIYGTPMPDLLVRDLVGDRRLRWLLNVARGSMAGEELSHDHHGAARKNFSHYMMSNDPRHLWHEMAFDLADGHDGTIGGRVVQLVSRFWTLARRKITPLRP